VKIVATLVPIELILPSYSKELVVPEVTVQVIPAFAAVESVIITTTVDVIVLAVCVDLVVPDLCVDVFSRIRTVYVVAFFGALAPPKFGRRTIHCTLVDKLAGPPTVASLYA
jgi:hypothetical protein